MQNVHQVASVALGGAFTERQVGHLLGSMDMRRLRSQMLALGVCEPHASDVHVAKLYFSKRCSAVSPNAFFDEAWYVDTYHDVRTAVNNQGLVSGFVHYIQRGMSEGRWPNSILAADAALCAVPEPELSALNTQAYLHLNPSAQTFLTAFPHVPPLAHYNLYGRLLGYKADRRRDEQSKDDGMGVVASAFDADFYRRTYLRDVECDDPLAHYLSVGAKAGNSPNPWFDERWYRAFYPEVRSACEDGWLPSGFFHYLYSGRNEGRQPHFVLSLALEARMPGITSPTLMNHAVELDRRLEPRHGMPQLDANSRALPAIWVIFPTLNPDIMFGGYRAVLWLIAAIVDAGFAVNAVCLQENPNLPYFLLREGSEAIRAVFSSITVLGKADFAGATFGPRDRFMAYSAWDLPMCARLAAPTGMLPLFLSQEYEPVFYDNGSHRALCESLYSIPHFAIINSGFLRDYFAAHGYGPFADPGERGAAARHVVFEHRILQLPRQTADSMRARSTRTLVLYARPESHASRNLFEIAVLALQRLCRESFFGPEWRFEGIGALSDLPPLELGDGHEMTLREKQSEEDYQRMCGSMDVGVSLMYAPHPSVMPFEFATTGALVVTNTYENRSAAQLRAISGNIVPCDISLPAVIAAIREAVGRVGDAEGRQARALVPSTGGWRDIFDRAFVESFAGPRPVPQPEAAVVPIGGRSRKPRVQAGADTPKAALGARA